MPSLGTEPTICKISSGNADACFIHAAFLRLVLGCGRCRRRSISDDDRKLLACATSGTGGLLVCVRKMVGRQGW